MTSTTELMRGIPLPAIKRRSNASAEPRYRAGSLPSALYPARVARIAGASRTARGSRSPWMRSSQARSDSSSARGLAPVSTPAATHPNAAFGHLDFSPGEMRTSVMRGARSEGSFASSLLQALDVSDQPVDLRRLQALSVCRHLVFAFFN